VHRFAKGTTTARRRIAALLVCLIAVLPAASLAWAARAERCQMVCCRSKAHRQSCCCGKVHPANEGARTPGWQNSPACPRGCETRAGLPEVATSGALSPAGTVAGLAAAGEDAESLPAPPTAIPVFRNALRQRPPPAV
jgi:hypothetical protein